VPTATFDGILGVIGVLYVLKIAISASILREREVPDYQQFPYAYSGCPLLDSPANINNKKSPQGEVAMSKNRSYWSANLRLVGLCLAIWFVVSYLFGIVLVEQLNTIQIGGYKLGFWFAQQGSIYVFVALIFFYARRMGKLDREHNVHEDDEE
jgi:putative solute:sodium symporter small subunit